MHVCSGVRACIHVCVCVWFCVCISLKITSVPFPCFSRAGLIGAGSVLELPGQYVCVLGWM